MTAQKTPLEPETKKLFETMTAQRTPPPPAKGAFRIVTNKLTAENIKAECKRQAKIKDKRSYKLGKIQHFSGYSTIDILPAKDEILHSDIFWLGHMSV